MLLNARTLQAGSHGELLVLAMEDVTERRRAEAELEAIETYAQDIVDTVRKPLLILDTSAARPQRQPRLLPDLPRLAGRRRRTG